MGYEYYNFIADTYYPSLAQFGIVGIILYITFWIYILMKAIKFHKRTYNMKCLSMVLMIIGFFIIEGTTDSTFTTHRGFFVLMLLGLILSDLKNGVTDEIHPNAKELQDENTSDK